MAKSSKNIIKDYLDHVNSSEYLKYLNSNPAGTSWSEYCHDFKSNVISKLNGKNSKTIFNLLIESGAINSPFSFDDKKTSSLAFEWHLERVKKEFKLREYFPEVQESDLIKGNCIFSLEDGRKFSLDTFRYLSYVQKINLKLCKINKIEKYLELGSGNGGFARTLKIINPKLKITLIDLPEVLFCSRIYLEESFPESKHIFIRCLDDFKNQEILDADFLYVSHSLFKNWSELKIKIDLFCNMRSIGEMPMDATSNYIKILEKVDIKNIFLENRFLNPYSNLYRNLLNFRRNEITGSTWMGSNWETIDFEHEPTWTKSPYESDHPRYLSLCLKSESDQYKNKIKKQDIHLIINSIKNQIWFDKFNDLKPWNLAYKPISTDSSTLKKLWEINRKKPTIESLKLIIDFIAYHFGTEDVEEIDYYKLILKNKFKSKHTSIIKFNHKTKFKSFTKKVSNRFNRIFLRKSLSQVLNKNK